MTDRRSFVSGLALGLLAAPLVAETQVATGMYRQGFLVALDQLGEHEWLAVFYTRGGGHSVMSAAGTAKEATPWRAVQRAAWGALTRTPA